MRIVLAPDKFKGCLTAIQVCDAMRIGIACTGSAMDVITCPMADGGEGTVDALVRAAGGSLVRRRVTGPLPEMKVEAEFGLLRSGHTAVIEMSSASGYVLLKRKERDPLATTTFGTGELINHAIELGCAEVLLGIGGSATNDGGIGCVQACGLTIVLEGGEPVSATEPLCGRDVERVLMVKRGRGERIGSVRITVACDVTNPLYGPRGASHVYGPQKGASPAAVERLDAALQQLARRTGTDDVARRPGAGAAGGIGFGLMAFCGATLRPGAELVMEAAGLRDKLRGADLCITGEGRLDEQSLSGKTVSAVARACRDLGVPCVALAGEVSLGRQDLGSLGLESATSIREDGMPLPESIRRAPELVASAVERLVGRFVGMRGSARQ